MAAQRAQTLFFGLFQEFSCVNLKFGEKVLNYFSRFFLNFSAIGRDRGIRYTPRRKVDKCEIHLSKQILKTLWIECRELDNFTIFIKVGKNEL